MVESGSVDKGAKVPAVKLESVGFAVDVPVSPLRTRAPCLLDMDPSCTTSVPRDTVGHFVLELISAWITHVAHDDAKIAV